MKYFRHCNPVTKRCKCDFGYTPITVETEKFKFEHICKVRKHAVFVSGNKIFIFKTVHISINTINHFQQATMAHTFHSDSFSGIHESTSYYPSNGTMQSRHNDKSLNEEKHKDMIIKYEFVLGYVKNWCNLGLEPKCLCLDKYACTVSAVISRVFTTYHLKEKAISLNVNCQQ